jgi:hypothetical protein
MPDLHVLNLGAGVQSTAVYLMAVEGLLHFDAAIFADTQDEPADVYRHLAWLQTLDGPPIHIATAGRLGDDLVRGVNSTGGRFAAIPAFTTKDGGKTHGLARRQCSKEYKTRVIEQTIRRVLLGRRPRQRCPKDVRVYQAFGISLDEARRAVSIRARFATDQKWATPVFPILDRQMTRADCLRWLEGRVPHPTPRSACVFCPYHTDDEWLHVQASPADWARAVEIDRALRAAGTVAPRDPRQVMYLHDSCQPLELVTFAPTVRRQLPLGFVRECTGGCGN